jgi:RimJ/RimL family protein N-acetyltransferase
MRLQGRRCVVRPWRLNDIDTLVRHANDFEVARQLRDRFPYPYTRHDGHAFLKHATATADPANLAIEVEGEAAGAIGYVQGLDVERYSAEIGYWLGRQYWRRGVVTEALSLVTEHVFAECNLLRLFALPFADNIGSVGVLEKAGYVREGLLRSSSVKHGAPRDQFLYARINPRWRGVDAPGSGRGQGMKP